MQRSANDTPKATDQHNQFSVRVEPISSTTQFLILEEHICPFGFSRFGVRRGQMQRSANDTPKATDQHNQFSVRVEPISTTTQSLISEEHICPFGFSRFGVRRLQIQRSTKIPTMGCTWRTAHCRDFLLAAVDVCLITPKIIGEV